MRTDFNSLPPGYGMSTPESEIPVVREQNHPETAWTGIGRILAGSAIEDHFQDVVLPTLASAFQRQQDRVLQMASKAVEQRLTVELRESLTPILNQLVRESMDAVRREDLEPILTRMAREFIAREGKPDGHVLVEILNRAEGRSSFLNRQHAIFPALLRLLCVVDRNDHPLNVALVGPAGNGKTSMALGCADALELEAVLQPFSPQTTKSDLLGFMAASGAYVASPFYDAFTTGKIFVADEFDAANPAIAVTLNAAVANRRVTFPNLATLKAHPNFRVIFIMNTAGHGSDQQYTGRLRQDAATLDRMVYLRVDIDPALEYALAGISVPTSPINYSSGERFKGNVEILSEIRRVRKAIDELRLNYVVSPRAVLHATAMHAGGFNREWIMKSCVWRGMPEVDMMAIIAAAGL